VQKWRYVELVEPEQATVRAIDEVVVAYTFIETSTIGQIQYQLPLGRHVFGFVVDSTRNRFSKLLDFCENCLVVEVCVCVDWLEKFETTQQLDGGDRGTITVSPPCGS